MNINTKTHRILAFVLGCIFLALTCSAQTDGGGAKTYIRLEGGYGIPSNKNHEGGAFAGGQIGISLSQNFALEIGGFFVSSSPKGELNGVSKGKISAYPLLLGLLYHFPVVQGVDLYLTGGGGYSFNRFTVDQEIAKFWKDYGFDLREKINGSALFYFGAGLEIPLGSRVGLFADARYYLTKANGSWSLKDLESDTEASGSLKNIKLDTILLGAGLTFRF
jgi:outer membrane protein W